MRARLAYAIRRVGAQAGSAKSEAQDSPFCGCSAGPLPAGYGASHDRQQRGLAHGRQFLQVCNARRGDA